MTTLVVFLWGCWFGFIIRAPIDVLIDKVVHWWRRREARRQFRKQVDQMLRKIEEAWYWHELAEKIGRSKKK